MMRCRGCPSQLPPNVPLGKLVACYNVHPPFTSRKSTPHQSGKGKFRKQPRLLDKSTLLRQMPVSSVKVYIISNVFDNEGDGRV